MEFWFTYRLKSGSTILRIGKSHCFEKNDMGVLRVLRKRYSYLNWESAAIAWHASESAALKRESLEIRSYADKFGSPPPYNVRAGGGGRQRYYKCKGLKINYVRCDNGALAGNYGYCGVHRRSV